MPYDFEARLIELGVAKEFLARRPPPVSDAEIERFERRIGGRLPGDYRAFLQAYGGFRPENGSGYWPERPRVCCRFVADVGCACADLAPFREHSVVWFLPLAHVEKLCEVSRVIPDTMIPIAEGESSIPTCLSFQGDDAGSVYSLDIQFLDRWPDHRFYQYANLHPDTEEWLRKRRDGELPRKKKGYEHLYLLAGSFTALLGRLHKASRGDDAT